MATVAIALAFGKLQSISARLDEVGSGGIWATIGFDGIDRTSQPALQQLPQDATLVLIGDARAYWYHRPMSRLRYRTVFDVDTGGTASVIDAWCGRNKGAADVLLVDPLELQRFARTYWHLPPLPAEWSERSEPFILDSRDSLTRD
jgi:hypothetical protein